VRDAAARLPGGEGSRADVCELLKESQFVLDGVHDAQISQVASGALDRLHQEADACVRYDSERKLWIYLHAQRPPADFPSFKAPQRKPPTGGAGGSLVPVAVPAPHGGPQMRM
jgi:hypothetical protein